MLAKIPAQSFIFQLNANHLHTSINHTNTNAIIEYNIFNFASQTTLESFHHKINFIQVYININKATKNIKISKSDTIYFKKPINHDHTIVQIQLSDQLVVYDTLFSELLKKASYIVHGILIKIIQIIEYQICLFADFIFSSSVHIDIIILAHAYTI
jgi:hypothetical protein